MIFALCSFSIASFGQPNNGDYQTLASGAWSSNATWQVYNAGSWNNCGPGDFPGVAPLAGRVTIRSGHAITLDLSPVNPIKELYFEPGNTLLSSVTFSGNFLLNVVNDVTYNVPGNSNNGDQTLDIGSGTLNCASLTMVNTNNDNRVQSLLISTGTFTASGNISMSTATRNVITVSGTGIINLGGNFTPGTGTFTAGTGTVNYLGTNQNVGNVIYYNLSSSNSGIKTLPPANLTINGNLDIANSTLAFDATAIRTVSVNGNLSGNGTIDMSSGNRTHILNLAGSTNSIGTLTTAATGSTVNYSGATDQTVFASSNYRNLGILNAGTSTLQGDISIGGNLSVTGGTFNLGTVATSISVAGNATINSPGGGLDFGSATGKNMTVNGILAFTAGTLEMSGSAGNILDLKGANNTGGGTYGTCSNNAEVRYSNGAQSVIAMNYCNLTISGSGTKTLLGTIGVNNNLDISGTTALYTNTFQINGNASGTFTMGTGTTLMLGNTANATAVLFPSNFISSGILLDPASTVLYQSNANQVVSEVPAYGNLTIATNGTTKTCAGDLTVNGNLTINGTSVFSTGASAVTWNIAGNLSGTGSLNMQGAGLAHVLNLGGANNAIANFNTTPGSGSTVNYVRAGVQQVFVTTSYQNVNLKGSGIKTMNAGSPLSIGGNLDITGVTFAFNNAVARVVNVSGNLSGNGTIDMSPGSRTHALNLSGASNTIGTLTTAAVASSVNYLRPGDQTVFGSPNYRNLVIDGGGIKSLQDMATVGGIFSLNLGVLQLNDHNLTFINLAPASFGLTTMVETNGAGRLIRSGNLTNASFNQTYPVGSGGYYNPLDITNLTGAVAAPRSLSVGAVAVNPGVLSNSINKYWDLLATNITTLPGAVLSLQYNAGEITGDPLLFQPFTNTSGNWALATGPSVPGSNPAKSTGSATITGFWTVGSPSTFYSYQSGFWDDPGTWTFDPGGTTGPGTVLPGDNDKVVILSGRTVSLRAHNFTKNLDITINSGAFLDQSSYSFWNSFAAFRGSGTFKLASSNFPDAVINTFVSTDGGTTEYNIDGPMSVIQNTYYNLVIRTTGKVTMTNSNTINGNLDVKQGIFEINDVSVRRLQLIIKGNVTVDNTGSITIGRGRTNSQPGPLPSITGSTTPPFLNYYELQSHRIQIYGDFTNNGIVKFSNLDYPVYNQFPSDGFATVYFNGLTDNTLTCNGRTDFYNLIIDKGTDQTYKLTVRSSAYNNFRIFGANTSDGSNTLPATPASNPNLKKALWIKNGSLVLQGLVVIPSLSEGATAGAYPSDFFIPANGALILDGGGVIVQSTADDFTEINAAYGLAGGSNALYGINSTGGYSGLSNLGKLQLNDGYLSTRESSGLNYWSYASGQYILNGGKMDTKQFHNPQGGATGLVSYVQNGGSMIIRGRFTNKINYTNPADLISASIDSARAINGIDIAAGIGAFNINSNAANGFSMAGGNMNIYDVCNTTATPYAFLVNCPVSNINVSGGTISMLPKNGSVFADADFMINSTGSFYNFTINRTSGGSSVLLNTNPLNVRNNLVLFSGTLTSTNLNVTVGGNFYIEAGTTYNPGTNTTIFNGTSDQAFTVNLVAPLSLNKLTVDKPSGTILNFAGTQKVINITSDFRLVTGTINDNGNSVNIAGNIFNSGIHTGTGKISLNGTAVQTIDGNGIFSNLELNNTNASATPVSLLDNITLNGTLTLSQDKIFDINIHNVTFNSPASIAGYSSTRYLKTSGNLGDGGITREYSSTAPFIFPMGVVSYTPATVGFNSAPAVYGSITVVPVNFAHPNVTAPGRSLSYFWRVKSTGVTLGTATLSYSFNYSEANVILGAGITEDGYVAARFNYVGSTWSKGTAGDVDETANIIGEPNPGSFLETAAFIDGDYTAGDDDPVNPFGVPAIYYSRQSGLWSNPNTWSQVSHSGGVAGSIPGMADIVKIGGQDSVYLATSFTVANTDVRKCASLQIEAGSVLDIGNNPNCNFTVVQSYIAGGPNGKIKLSATNPGTYNPFVIPFPSGDFSDFNINGGTTHYYTGCNCYAQFYLTSAVTTYGNVIFSPAGTDNIIFPNRDVTILGNLTNLGTTRESWLCPSWYDGPAYAGASMPFHTPGVYHTVEKTVHIKGDFLMNGGTFFYTSDNNLPQHVIVDGNLTIAQNAGLDVYYNAGGNYFGNTTQINTLEIGGNFINNSDSVRFNYNNGSRICDVFFTGSNNAAINSTGGTPKMHFHNLTVNKGNSQATTLTLSFPGSIQYQNPADNWLFLQNGTFIYNKTGNLPISTNTPFVIAPTAGLTINTPSSVYIANANSDGNDFILNGKFTLLSGTVYVGPSASPVNNNDIEYSVGGFSEIDIQNGSLIVNGQVRRNPSSAGGILKYSQSNGSVTIRGQKPNGTNADFEVVNGGSLFNMSDGTLTILRGNGAPSFGDLYLRPGAGSVTGGTIIFSQGALAAPQDYLLDATIPLNNITITGASATNYAKLKVLTSPLTVNGNMTINANSILDANNVNVTFNGNLVNTPGVSGYLPGTNTTTFSASSGSSFTGQQSITGATSFYDLVVSPGVSLTLNDPSTVNRNLSINTGTFRLLSNPVNVKGDISNNSGYSDNNTPGTGLLMTGTVQQHISGTGAFARLTLNNAAGASVENDISVQEDLTLTTGILDIKKYLLTLGTGSNLQGAPFSAMKMITSDGVFSNVGIRKFFNPGATTFLYPLGTNGKYTPALLTTTASSTVGFIRVNNISSRHPAVKDPLNSLNYYWEIQSSGITGFNGSMELNYLQSDVTGDESGYMAAKIPVPGTLWTLEPGVETTLNKLTFTYTGSNNLSGEYTAGTPPSFFTNTPIYTTIADGFWDDPAIWSQTGGDPFPCPPTGPNGFILNINHVVTIRSNYCFAYRINLDKELRVEEPYYGHNFGTVTGNGLLHLERGTFPAGVYTAFLSCAGSGTVEYGGIGTYTIIADLYDNIPNIRFTGTGSRIMPNKDLTVCKSFKIDGPVVDNSVYNKKLIILGTIEHISGSFSSGTGAGATVSFAGPVQQTIGGATLGNFTGASAFNNLEINNAAGLRINDAGSVEVKGILMLTNGLINTASDRMLTITNSAVNSVFPAGGSTVSFVDGPLSKNISQFDNFLFPIGLDNGSDILGNRLRISSTQTGPTIWSAQYNNPNPTNKDFAPPLLGVSDMEFYTVKAPAASLAKVNLNWIPSSDVNPVTTGGISNIRVARFNSGTSLWNEVTTSSVGDNSNGTASSTGLVTFDASTDLTLGSVTTLIPRAQFTPAGAVCGADGIPVTFSAPGPIPFDYEIRYRIDGGPVQVAAVTSVPFILPTPVPGSYKLTAFTYDNGSGIGVVDATPVSVYPEPTVSDAGDDQIKCGVSTTLLEGNAFNPVTENGMWSILSGTGGTVIAPSNPTSQFIGLNGKQYFLRWSINSGGACTSTDDVVINFTILPDAPAAAPNQSFCGPDTVGHLVAIPPALSTVDWYSAASGGVLLPGATALVSGTTYYAESNAGCVSLTRTPVTVTINSIPVVGLSGNNNVCINSTGNIYSTEPGMSNYVWALTGGFITGGLGTNSVSVTWNVSGPQTISVNYQNAGGCSAASPTIYNVNVNPEPSITLGSNPIVCSGAISANLAYTSVTGNPDRYSIDYDAAAEAAGFVDLPATTVLPASPIILAVPGLAPAGTYSGTLTVIKNSPGCISGTYPISVTINPKITGSAAVTTAIVCNGGAATVTLTGAGGTLPLSYTFNGVTNGTGIFGGISAGLGYAWSITDAGSCTPATGTLDVTEPAGLSGTIVSQTNVTVFGGTDGSVEVGGVGGTPAYQYSLDGGAYQASGIFGSLAAGSYTVTVQDNNLCTADVPVTITEPPLGLSGSITAKTNVQCFGTASGSVTVDGSGGVPPYEYQIDGGAWQNTGTFNALAFGNYIVTIRDAALNTFDVPVSITSPVAALGATISQVDVLCFGNNTGSITATGTGGIGPYQYTIDGGSYQPLGVFAGLTAGTHTISVKDSKNCTYSVDVIITEPAAALTGSISAQSDVSCFGLVNGSVTIAGNGGTAPYSYSLEGGAYQASGVFSGLAASTYTLTVRDANLCTVDIQAVVAEPFAIDVSYTKVDATCPGEEQGSITLTITGGRPPYSVIWSDGPTTQNRDNLTDTTYTAIVRDVNGCPTPVEVTIGFTGSENCIEILDIITPNGDGHNDTWKIKNIDLFPNAEVFVFNRWGKKVFSSRNVSADEWDGTFKGKALPTDSYHYILHLNDGSEPRSGVVSIIR